jgi:hypothetical protein
MKTNTRFFSLVALLVVLLSSACAGNVTGTPTPDGSDETPSAVVGGTSTVTATAGDETVTPDGMAETATPDGTQQAPVLIQVGEFCVESFSHVVLTAPLTASFEVVMFANTTPLPAPGVECDSVKNVADRQILLCGGQQDISFNLELCEGTNCTETRVNLPACSMTTPQGTATAPATGTATVTISPTVAGGGATGTSTAAPGSGTNTPTMTVTPTP